MSKQKTSNEITGWVVVRKDVDGKGNSSWSMANHYIFETRAEAREEAAYWREMYKRSPQRVELKVMKFTFIPH